MFKKVNSKVEGKKSVCCVNAVLAVISFLYMASESNASEDTKKYQEKAISSINACIDKYSDSYDSVQKIHIECSNDFYQNYCLKETDQTQIELNFCSGAESQAWDSIMYIQLEKMRKSGRYDVELLEKSQREWADYKNAQCELEAKMYEGGSIAGLILSSCRSKMITRRVTDLIVLQRE